MYIVNSVSEAGAAFSEILEELGEFFHPDEIKWKPGSRGRDGTAQALAHIDARNVMERLDSVVGSDGWEDSYRVADSMVQIKGKNGMEEIPKTIYICTLRIRIWCQEIGNFIEVCKEGISDETDFDPVKGGASGAFKRAAVKFGIGRYLYEFPTQYVKMKDNGYGFAEKPKYPRQFLPKSLAEVAETERPYPKKMAIEVIREWASREKRQASDKQRNLLHACMSKGIFEGDQDADNTYKKFTQIVFERDPDQLDDNQVIALLNSWIKPYQEDGKWKINDVVKDEAYNIIL